MNRKQAFTLAEILIVLTIIGVLALVTLRSFNAKTTKAKLNFARADKAVEVFNNVCARIRLTESKACPHNTFIIDTGFGTYEKGLLKCTEGESGEETCSPVTSQDAINIFSEHTKFEKKNLNFCDYSGNCSVTAAGAELPGGIYVGIEVLEDISDCPAYYMPGDEEETTPPSGSKCWAKLYVDANGPSGPNELGQDVFVFGMDADGVLY